MPQRVKVTRELDLHQTARVEGLSVLTKTVNYALDEFTDSGKIFCASNSGHTLFFRLPPVANTAGHIYTFFNTNTGGMMIESYDAGTVNTIFSEVSVNGAHLIGTVNMRQATNIAAACKVIGTGSRYMLFNYQITNVTNIREN